MNNAIDQLPRSKNPPLQSSAIIYNPKLIYSQKYSSLFYFDA